MANDDESSPQARPAVPVKVARTLDEPHGEAAARRRILVRVLCYDDLLADDTQVFSLPPAEAEAQGKTGPSCLLSIGRAEDAETAGLFPTADAAKSQPGEPVELRLFDRFLSGTHAQILSVSGGDVLRDHRSRNGTYINGGRISDQQPLADGDLIEVGHTLLCYRVLDERTYFELQEGLSQGIVLGPTKTFCGELVALVRELHWLAPSGESVLLLSESGTGKEIAAQMVHRLSGREGPFCPVDAGAVPESLFESVLFGHRRGAFTGAAADQAGHLLRAHRGTLFLDEVANMSLSSQAKLLRVIEDGKVTPLGAAVAQQVDVRWIAATNVNIFAEATPFRKDLLRRLAGHVARLPPLRRRREDLGVLTAHFLRETGVTAASITTLAGRRLFNERFAGNVRQLRSLLRSAVLLAPEGRIDLPHLSSLYAATAPLTPPLPLPAAVPPREGKNDEPDHDPDSAEAGRRPTPEEIERSLTLCRGNVVRAAQRLGVHPRQLYRLIERYAIDLRRYRD